MAGIELSAGQLNRAVLARQLLLERHELDLPEALERVAGLQDQYAPSGYIGVWSRLAGFERAQLTEALEHRTVVQATLMRATIHLVSARDFHAMSAAIRDGRRQWWLRTTKADVQKVDAAARRVCDLLSSGPRRRDDVIAELDLDAEEWAGVGMVIDLIRVPPSGTWERRRADLYAVADDWLGSAEVDPDAGLDLIVRRYLGAFGPATPAEIGNWAGLPVAAIGPALGRLDLCRVSGPDGATLLDVPGAPIPRARTPAPVRFLPTWDATLLVHARRAGVLPEHHRAKVFSTRTPQSIGTFLVDGRVAGTWTRVNERVVPAPFEQLGPRVQREVDDEAERLSAFMS